MNKTVQAKHVPESDLLMAVKRIRAEKAEGKPFSQAQLFSADRWELQRAFDQFPPKVVLAKLRSLLRRGLLDGCGCGCSGGFFLTEAGKQAIADALDNLPEKT